MKINDPLIDQLKVYMDFAARKQQVINSNLANAETPGYKTKEIVFEDFLRGQMSEAEGMRRSRDEHIDGKPVLQRTHVTEVVNDSLGNDRNNVDLDREMTALAQNVLRFTVVGQFLQKKFQGLLNSIKEGRG